jgi:hypothetical protein
VTNGPLVTNGTLTTNGQLVANGGITASSVTTPGGTFTVNNGLVVNKFTGQADAALFNGDIEIDGAGNPLDRTLITGRVVSVQSSVDPGFVALNTLDNIAYGMWSTAGQMTFGLADGAPSGNIAVKLAIIDGAGNLTIRGSLTSQQPLSAPLMHIAAGEGDIRNVRALEVDCAKIVRDVLVQRYRVGVSDADHWGFSAGDVDRATGGVIGDAGQISLGEMVAVVWKALQQLDWRVGEVEGKIGRP